MLSWGGPPGTGVGESLRGLPKSGDIVKNTCEGKTLRLNRELYQKKGQPFSITVCTHNKIPLLNEFNELIFQSIVKGTLRKASDLTAVCVMPDHIHFLLAPISENLVDLWKVEKLYTSLDMQKRIQRKSVATKFL